MTRFNEKIDDVIEGLRISLGTDEAYWAPIESAMRVLESLKILGRSGVRDMTDLDFTDFILNAIAPLPICRVDLPTLPKEPEWQVYKLWPDGN